MQKIVINRCVGGFGLSAKAREYLRVEDSKYNYEIEDEIHRDDPKLVACIEELGRAANGEFAELAIVEIPDNVQWTIENYNGNEWIAEVHRTWR